MKRSVMCRIRVSTTFKGHSCLHGTWFHTGGYGWWKCERVTKTIFSAASMITLLFVSYDIVTFSQQQSWSIIVTFLRKFSQTDRKMITH